MFPALGSRYRVIAFDQRGHGDGLPSGPHYRLADCADDVAALAGALGVDRLVVAGYSMGGMIAQQLCRRHPGLVSGLVLCGTAATVRESPFEELVALGLPMMTAAMAWNPAMRALSAGTVGSVLLGDLPDPAARAWAVEQLRRTSLLTAVSAMQAVCEFNSTDWIGGVRVPTAVVVTTRDRIVPPGRQLRLAAAIPGATVVELPADHGVCVTAPGLFADALLEACRAVAPPAVVPEPAVPEPGARDGEPVDAGRPVDGVQPAVPVATYPVPKATSRTWKWWSRRSSRRQGRSKPPKSET